MHGPCEIQIKFGAAVSTRRIAASANQIRQSHVAIAVSTLHVDYSLFPWEMQCRLVTYI